MRLTSHFSLAEFACKDGTPYPSKWIDSRLRPLCTMLENLRMHLKTRLRIVSGFRTEVYNRHIGGARKSQHTKGTAADIVAIGIAPAELHEAILWLYDNDTIVSRTLGGLGRYPGFVHVDIRRTSRLVRWSGSRT